MYLQYGITFIASGKFFSVQIRGNKVTGFVKASELVLKEVLIITIKGVTKTMHKRMIISPFSK